MYKLQNSTIVQAEVHFPSNGAWTASVESTDDATCKAGDSVSLTLGSLVLRGYVTRGGVNTDSARFFLVGGYGGWRKAVKRRFYDDKSGIRLSLVLRHLADEVGEKVDVPSSISNTVLGPTWSRAAGSAALALEDMRQTWRVRPDGVTTLGPLIRSTSKKNFAVTSFRADSGIAVVEFPEDSMDECLPGYTIRGSDFTLDIQSSRLIVADGDVHAEVFT